MCASARREVRLASRSESREQDTNVLGISAFFHDASAALVRNGVIVAAAAEERFTRLKHDANFPALAARFCLEQGGLSAENLHAVVFYEQPWVKFTRVLTSLLAGFPASRRMFVSNIKEWLADKLWIQLTIARELGVDPKVVRFVQHHDAHQAQAFLCSPFEEAAVLTIDAVGEWTCTSIGHGSRHREPFLTTADRLTYPHSLGLAYSAFTAFLGFRPNDSEASTMALAAFGRPRFADQVRQIIRVDADGLYQIDGRFFDFMAADAGLFTSDFVRLFGEPRDFHHALPFDALEDHFSSRLVSADDARFADIAASVQRVLEEAVLALAKRARRLGGASDLCFAGGVALNAVVNTKLLEESGFDRVFIPPDPGDGGAAVGAALLESSRLMHRCPPGAISPFIGASCDKERTAALIACLGAPADWASHTTRGAVPRQGEIGVAAYDDFSRLADDIADEILDGLIIGWMQGRFEQGPRALGNRSILVHPGKIASVRRLSRAVKHRASFRPYALAICEEDAPAILEIASPIPQCARWMQMVTRVRHAAKDHIRCAMHCDGTTRVQVCSSADNPLFHRLLLALRKRAGLGAVLNTSFNESGYPIVSTPAEALLMFARTDMDTLVIDGLVARREADRRVHGHNCAFPEFVLGASAYGRADA